MAVQHFFLGGGVKTREEGKIFGWSIFMGVEISEMEKFSGSSGAANANFAQLCKFLLFLRVLLKVLPFFVQFGHFGHFLHIFCVLIFQTRIFACAIL